MQVPALSFGVGEPVARRFGLVGRQVVQHDVDVEVGGGVQVDPLEEGEHVFPSVAAAGLVEHLAGGDVQGGEQVQRAVPFVVMGEGAVAARHHGKRRLGAVQGLDLGLLVEAEHRGPLRGVQVQADHVDELGLEVGVFGQLEHIGEPRAQPPRPPDARHGVLAHPSAGRHRPRRPARRPVLGLAVQGVGHDRLHHRLGNTGLAAPPRRHRPHPVGPRLQEPVPPRPHRVLMAAQTPGHRPHRPAVGQRQKRPRPHHPPMRLRPRPRHALQRLAITGRQHKRNTHHPTLTAPTKSATNH